MAGCYQVFDDPTKAKTKYMSYTWAFTDLSCSTLATPTTTAPCPSMTISYPDATASPYTTTMVSTAQSLRSTSKLTYQSMPCGEPGCKKYNPKSTFFDASICDEVSNPKSSKELCLNPCNLIFPREWSSNTARAPPPLQTRGQI